MSIFQSMKISSSALDAQTIRMNTISSNLANINSTSTPDGDGPYSRKMTVFRSERMNFQDQLAFHKGEYSRSVAVDRIVTSNDPPRQVYDPSHPDADGQGYVLMPDISLVREMSDMQEAVRSYEANVISIKNAQRMAMNALQIIS